jgi:Domain of unknown function (DUF3854)
MLSIDLSLPDSTPPKAEGEVVMKEPRYMVHLDGVGAMSAGGAQGMGPCLLPHHAEMLKASGISDDVIRERGYRSVKTHAELKRLGFGTNQLNTPSLLIPVYGFDGQIATYQHRPDEPRVKNGKALKYETPSGSRMVLDVPPRVRPTLASPIVPLFITEGVKKADAAASQRLCCIALLGVWNWRGRNDQDGMTALGDWDAIALKAGDGEGRPVYIVFDSDVAQKPAVAKAMRRLQAFLRSRGADVWIVYLPP